MDMIILLKKMQIIRINNYLTPIDKEKIPKKKFNFNEFLYKKRIKYGKYIEMGLVSDKVKFCIKDGNIIYQLDEKVEENSENKNDINNKYLNKINTIIIVVSYNI